MFHYNDVKRTLIEFLGTFDNDIDVDSVMDALREAAPDDVDVRSVDDYDSYTFYGIIEEAM